MFKEFSDYVKNKIAYNKALKHPIYSKVMMVSQATIKQAGLDILVKRGSPAIIARANDLHNYIINVLESADPTLPPGTACLCLSEKFQVKILRCVLLPLNYSAAWGCS
jgi:hypothetical protein